MGENDTPGTCDIRGKSSDLYERATLRSGFTEIDSRLNNLCYDGLDPTHVTGSTRNKGVVPFRHCRHVPTHFF